MWDLKFPNQGSHLRPLHWKLGVLTIAVCVISCLVMSSSLWPHGLQPARFLCPCRFSRQEYWSGLPFPSPGDLSHPGIKAASPVCPAWQVDSLPTESLGNPQDHQEVPDVLLWDERILRQAPRHFMVTRKSAACCKDPQHLDCHNPDRAGFK